MEQVLQKTCLVERQYDESRLGVGCAWAGEVMGHTESDG